MVPCGFQMVLCGFPMVLCHGAASRHSPAQLCGLPYGALRLPDGALPRRCHQALTSTALRASLWCRATALPSGTHQRSSASSVPQSQRCGIHFRAAVSGAAEVSPAQRQVLPRSAVGKHHLPSCSCAPARRQPHPAQMCQIASQTGVLLSAR